MDGDEVASGGESDVSEEDLLFERLVDLTRDDLRALARSLVGTPAERLFGENEYRVRDAVHAIGAKALEAALATRKKTATSAAARSTRKRAGTRGT